MGKAGAINRKRAVSAAKSKGRFSKNENETVEDLDLDVGSYFQEENDKPLYATYDNPDDERIMFNQKAKKATKGGKGAAQDNDSDDDGLLTVAPTEAHKGSGIPDDDVAAEEAAIALRANRRHKRTLDDEDFGEFAAITSKQPVAAKVAPVSSSSVMAAVESVQRDYSSLSASDKITAMQKDSPELVGLLKEYRTYLDEVTAVAKPLHDLIHNTSKKGARFAKGGVGKGSTDRNLVLFLETKVQLLLSYCMHVSFYLLLKTEGRQVQGHPVLDRLVELRVYIEKLWPLEKKLQYSLNKLFSGAATDATEGTGQSVNITKLRPVQGDAGGVYKPSGAKLDTSDRKTERMALRQLREAEALDRAERDEMTRVQRKKSANALDASVLASVAKRGELSGYTEDADQFFTRMAADESDDDAAGGTLIEKLRARANKKSAPQQQVDEEEDDEEEDMGSFDEDEFLDEEGDEEDMFDDEEDEEVAAIGSKRARKMSAYDRLVAEEQDEAKSKRQLEEERKARNQAEEDAVEGPGRRKIDRRIETHRGETRVRPKDRKTPHLAQRHKYAKGLAKVRSHTKSFKPEPEAGFSGTIRPGIKHSTRL
jgi:U3 small nucleolar RNA-associated protein 3